MQRRPNKIVEAALLKASLDERLPEELRARARVALSNHMKFNAAMERENATFH